MEIPVISRDPAPAEHLDAKHAAQIMLNALGAGLGAQMGSLCNEGLAPEDLAMLLFHHMAGMVSRIEPFPKREQIVNVILGALPQLVTRYEIELRKTPGGVIRPDGHAMPIPAEALRRAGGRG